MDQVKFVEKPLKNLKRYSLLNRPYHFKFFKNCIPQTLLDSFLNKLSIALLETFQSNQNTTFFPSALFRVTFMLESDEAPFFLKKKKKLGCKTFTLEINIILPFLVSCYSQKLSV